MLKPSLALLFAFTLATAAFGQARDPLKMAASAASGMSVSAMQAVGGVDSPDATCVYQFTIPATATKQYLQYCVNSRGNIVEFQSPAGIENIAAGTNGEGYSVCDFNSGIGYLDYGDYGDFDAGHWGAPVLLNLTATQVKIARTTTDGIWTLTQTFTKSPADSTVKLAMALKNNTGVSRSVWLTRWADIDANSTFSNTLDGTFNTAFGYTASTGIGMQLTLAVANNYPHYGFAVPTINTACNIGSGYAGTLIGVDGVVNFYHYITIAKGKTATVTFKYRGM